MSVKRNRASRCFFSGPATLHSITPIEFGLMPHSELLSLKIRMACSASERGTS